MNTQNALVRIASTTSSATPAGAIPVDRVASRSGARAAFSCGVNSEPKGRFRSDKKMSVFTALGHVRGVRHVGQHAEHVATRGNEALRLGDESSFFHISHDDPHAFGHESLAHGQTDAARGTGHHGNLPYEIIQHGASLPSRARVVVERETRYTVAPASSRNATTLSSDS